MHKKKYPEPFEALILTLGIFIGLFIITEVLNTLFSMDVADTKTADKRVRYFFLFGTTLFFIVPYFYSKMRDYEIVTLFRLRPVPLSVILLSILGGLALTVLVDELDRIINIILPIPDWMEEMMRPLTVETTWDWILAISGVVVAAGFAEESLFRGFIQVSLEKKGDVTKAVMLSAATWAIIHIVPYWIIQIFIIGVVFGYLSWRTGSIIPSMIMHALNNLVALLFMNLDLQSYMSWYLLGDHVSPVVLVIAAGIFYYAMRQITFIYRQ